LEQNSFQLLSKKQVARLHGLDLNVANLASDEFDGLMRKILGEKSMERFPELNSAILKVVKDVLDEYHGELERSLRDYVGIQTSFADSRNEEFDKKIVEIKYNIDQAPHRKAIYGYDAIKKAKLDQIWTVRQLVTIYVKEVQVEYTKYCKKATGLKIIDALKQNLLGQLVSSPYNFKKKIREV